MPEVVTESMLEVMEVPLTLRRKLNYPVVSVSILVLKTLITKKTPITMMIKSLVNNLEEM